MSKRTPEEVKALLSNVYGPVTGAQHPRKRDQLEEIERSTVQALAGEHVEAMISNIANLSQTGYREDTRLKASLALIELALGDSTKESETRVYVLQADPRAVADEARKRLGK